MQTPNPDPESIRRLPPSENPKEPNGRRGWRIARRVWDPAPVPKPTIDPYLDQLTWPERCAEVLRHGLLSLEYWLSQGGWLREWIRLNLWVGVVLLVAAIMVVPPVTALLEGVRDWTGLVSTTVSNINAAVSALPAIVLALATAFVAVKLIQRYRAGRRQRRHPYDHYE